MAISTTVYDTRGNDQGHLFAEISCTTTGTGEIFDLSFQPLRLFSLQASVPSGIPISWTVILEGSINGSQFDTILTSTNVVGLSVLQISSPVLVRFVRARVTSLILGTSPSLTVDILGAM